MYADANYATNLSEKYGTGDLLLPQCIKGRPLRLNFASATACALKALAAPAELRSNLLSASERAAVGCLGKALGRHAEPVVGRKCALTS